MKKNIAVTLNHRYLDTKDVTMQTDAEGTISFGFLEDVYRLTVESQSLKIGVKFELPDNFS